MRTFHRWVSSARWQHSLAAGVGAWASALVANPQGVFDSPKIVAALVMFFGVVGTSLYYAAIAQAMYARKQQTWRLTSSPALMILLGLVGLSSAMTLAASFINPLATLIVAVDVLIVVLYGPILSRHWLLKNPVIVFTTVSPVLLGWSIKPHSSLLLSGLVSITATIFWAREIIKDIEDVRYDLGHRLTLPMVLGRRRTMRVAAGLLCLAGMMLAILAPVLLRAWPAYLATLVLLTGLSIRLWHAKKPGNAQERIFLIAVLLIMTALLYQWQQRA